jgi:hypothetical protein
MIPITPSGTRILPTCIPDGRYFKSVISPTGSGSAAICSNPSAMPAMLLAVSVRRSIIAESRPRFAALSTSIAFAASSTCSSRLIAAAICSSDLFFAAVSAFATRREAARASRPTDCI